MKTLLLNFSYEPLDVISWRRAIRLLFLGKIEILEEYDSDVRSVSFAIKAPSVVRLLRYIKTKKKEEVKFSRFNVFARDSFTCQYCNKKQNSEDLTFDHVVPRSQGGTMCWENVVACCVPCNLKKGGRTPKEAHMKLTRKPVKPKYLPYVVFTLKFKRTIPETWVEYLYWNEELINEKRQSAC
jgi:5-methylcytosine-specific restriction endonuclease McrA